MSSPLPPLPGVRLEILDAPPPQPGFLRVRHWQLRTRAGDGTMSEPFAYDQVERNALDAVVLAAHFRDHGVLHVWLRSALRPPVALRPAKLFPFQERATLGHLWELPAGLVEREEQSEQGLRVCAARELHEELGFLILPDLMYPLGPSTFPAPSVIAERHFYFHCRVDPATRNSPLGDGSPLERHAAITSVPLPEALRLVRNGEIEDAKTEIALRRLEEFDP